MSYETITLSIENAVAHLTLNRPDAANGMNLSLMRELADAVHTCGASPDVRAVLVTGSGRFFSAGGDLQSFATELDNLPRLLNELTLHLHAAISRLVRMNAPVIAAVNGPCAGAGMSLACACDYVMVAESASFTMAYTAAGLSPDGSSTWFLPRRIGELRTRELMLTNRKLSAAEAVDWGLANQVVPDADLMQEAEKLAAHLAKGPTRSFGRVKALLNDTFSHGMETQMELEARAIASAATTADAQAGIRAFLAKEKPDFSGA